MEGAYEMFDESEYLSFVVLFSNLVNISSSGAWPCSGKG